MSALIRLPKYSEIAQCVHLAFLNWGPDAAVRCREQLIEHFRGGKYAPTFLVAANNGVGLVGFAAYQGSMRMRDAYDLIWIAVHPDYQGKGVGKLLTEARLSAIKRRGGSLVSLVTQKPKFFARFGFKSVDTLDGWIVMHLKLSTVRM